MEQKLPLVIFKKFCWTLFCQVKKCVLFQLYEDIIKYIAECDAMILAKHDLCNIYIFKILRNIAECVVEIYPGLPYLSVLILKYSTTVKT